MKMRRIAAALLLAALLLVTLTGCKEKATSIARQFLGTADEAEEEDTTNWALDCTDDIYLPEGMDSTAKFTSQRGEDGMLYYVFNGIWTRETGYFHVPDGSLTIVANGHAEGTQRYKISVWKRLDNATEYVAGSTGYIHTDGKNYRFTVTGLDPEASYRLTISYDSSRYYLYGMAKVEGTA